MKRQIIGALFISSLFAVAPLAYADAFGDLQNQIQVIMAQIAALRAQLAQRSATAPSIGSPAVTTEPTATPPTTPFPTTSSGDKFCFDFSRYLTVGVGGGAEVNALARVLATEGFLSGDKYDFNDDVAAAVVKFQIKYGITPTGTVGPLTRAKLNSLYGCPRTPIHPDTSTQPSITSISPTQGTAGTSVTIYGTNLFGVTTVEFYDTSGLLKAATPVDMTSVSASSVTFRISGLFEANVSPGVYQVNVVKSDCRGGCSSNRLGFGLTASNTSTQPSITVTYPNGGETFIAGEPLRATWRSQNLASDGYHNVTVGIESASKGGITYKYEVDPNSGSYTLIIPASVQQGNDYKVVVSGAYARDTSDSTFTIAPSQTVTVQPPASSAASVYLGGSANPTVSYGSSFNFIIVPTNAGNCSVSGPGSWLVRNPDSGGTWNTGPLSSSVTYTVSCAATGFASPASPTATKTVTVSPSTTPTTPSITVIAPNGGETLVAESTYRIRWSSSGVSGAVEIDDVSSSNVGVEGFVATVSAGQGYYDWTVPNNPGTWRIRIVDPNNLSAQDQSNSAFTITAPITPPSTQPSTASVYLGGSQAPTVSYGASFNFLVTPTNTTNCSVSGPGSWLVHNPESLGGGGTWTTGNLTSSVTYTATCTAKAGATPASVTATKAVTVTPQVVTPATPTVDLKVNGSDGPITIAEGSSFTVTWTSTGATSCYSGGSGQTGGTSGWNSNSRPSSGSVSISAVTGVLNQNEFTIVCNGANDTAVVNVTPTPASYTLSVNKSGSGSTLILSDTGGIGCSNSGSTCSASYTSGTRVTLSAGYNASFTSLIGWTGCESASGNTCIVTMNGPRSVTATFNQVATANFGVSTLYLNADQAGGGAYYPGTMTLSSLVTNSGGASGNATAVFEYSTGGTPDSYWTDWVTAGAPGCTCNVVNLAPNGGSQNVSYTWQGGVWDNYIRMRLETPYGSYYTPPIRLRVIDRTTSSLGQSVQMASIFEGLRALRTK